MAGRTIFAATLTVVATALVLLQALLWSHSANFGPIVADAGRCALRVVSPDPLGPSSGVRDGDVILIDQMDRQARSDLVFHSARAHVATIGWVATLQIERDGKRLSVPYTFTQHDPRLVFLAQLAFKLVILAIGLFVLWRGRDAAATWLGAWCAGIAVALPDAWWGGLPDLAHVGGDFAINTIWTCLPFGLYMVVETIVTGVSKPLKWVARVLMVVSLLPSLFGGLIDPIAQIVSGCSVFALNPTLVNGLFVGTQLLVLAYFIVGYAGTKGLDRLRLRWVFWAFVFSRVGVLINLVNRLAPHPLHLSGIEWLTIVFFPLGCSYAILRHRLIDVNFVLNRTLVYTILTTVVVGTFVLVENVVGSLAVGRGVGLAVDIVVTLGLGFSFNALHRRVEEILERTLFRAKYEALNQLQQLAEEAPYMESADALLVRATQEIPLAMGAVGAAAYERVDGHYRLVRSDGISSLPERVDPDDPAFVRLRQRLSQVDLADVNSALGNDAIAFAFALRGQLSGAFLCGRKKNGETYAPDEIAAVRTTVHDVGAELSAIRARERSELLEGLVTGRIDLATARGTWEG